jgi:hypothetical protein
VKRCRICRTEFEPRNTLQQTCKPACAIEYSRTSSKERLAKDAKRAFHVERRVSRRRGALTKAKDGYQARADGVQLVHPATGSRAAVHLLWQLHRRQRTGSRWDAGHYRSTGAAPHLRFNEDNCHRQRVVCNRNGSGRAVEYRRGLINRIGIARVEALENDNSIRKFSALELREVRDLYRRRRKEMEKAAMTCRVFGCGSSRDTRPTSFVRNELPSMALRTTDTIKSRPSRSQESLRRMATYGVYAADHPLAAHGYVFEHRNRLRRAGSEDPQVRAVSELSRSPGATCHVDHG